ncbi:M48 family metallopeptidase [Aliarcobacter skirrowii]|uniref:M48 family metallopeptidase n=1 Tax=Aliarcobacter skirrowii TaxID=28200 RepID=UPI0021B4BD9C|nr:M48 family metallopeptidase [Aliarcobacter skirrowii]MCT7447280.1 M48 family metallopeptidase [Aliarcobacter skirrowii]MDD3026233.1 M48 family metallopeptidase [Aliarcobacter skirrowii]MDX4037898.1 M48 family metallopeptidase [Aliarcobacter skirrowii]
MNFKIELNNFLVDVELQNKKNIKHCYLRVLSDNLIQIKANRYFTILDAKDLIYRKKDWLIENIQKQNSKKLNENEFLYFGEKKLLSDFLIKDLDKFYKEEIQKIIPSLVEKYSNLMQLYPTKISYRKNRRTWGSCNFKNELNFNILLAKYPIFIIEYIVIHELAHIQHKNHSKDFYFLVEKFSPNYKKIEKFFKTLL